MINDDDDDDDTADGDKERLKEARTRDVDMVRTKKQATGWGE